MATEETTTDGDGRTIADMTIDELDDLLEPWCDPLHHEFSPHDPRWASMPVDVRMAFMEAGQRRAVLLQGYTFVGVFQPEGHTPDPGDLTHPFLYSVGVDPAVIVVADMGHPDDWQLGKHVAETAIARIEAGTAVGETWEQDAGGYLMVLAPVPAEWFERLCTQAVGATGAVQVLWQDDERRWPWDLDDPVEIPVVLAGDAWRPGP